MTVFNKIIQKQFRNELKQIKKPYQSTLDFFQFVKRYNGFKPNTSVLDAGSGIGSNTFFFANKEKSIKFICGDSIKKIFL